MCLGQEVHYYIVHIEYHTELNLQTRKQNDAFAVKIRNTRLPNSFLANYALAERLPTSATLACTT